MKVSQSPVLPRVFGTTALLFTSLSFSASSRTACAIDASQPPSTQPIGSENPKLPPQLTEAQKTWLATPICRPTAEEFESAINGATSNSQIVSRLMLAAAEKLNLPGPSKDLLLANPFIFSPKIQVEIPRNYDLPLTTDQLTGSKGKVVLDEVRDRKSIALPSPVLLSGSRLPALTISIRPASAELVTGNKMEFSADGSLFQIESARSLYLNHSIVALGKTEYAFNYYFTDILLGRGQITVKSQSYTNLLDTISSEGWARTLVEKTPTFEDLTPRDRYAFAVLLSMSAQGKLGENLPKPTILCLVDASARNPACLSPEQFSALEAKAKENSFRVEAAWANASGGSTPIIVGGAATAGVAAVALTAGLMFRNRSRRRPGTRL